MHFKVHAITINNIMHLHKKNEIEKYFHFSNSLFIYKIKLYIIFTIIFYIRFILRNTFTS
jgi:hypothetical protein